MALKTVDVDDGFLSIFWPTTSIKSNNRVRSEQKSKKVLESVFSSHFLQYRNASFSSETNPWPDNEHNVRIKTWRHHSRKYTSDHLRKSAKSWLFSKRRWPPVQGVHDRTEGDVPILTPRCQEKVTDLRRTWWARLSRFGWTTRPIRLLPARRASPRASMSSTARRARSFHVSFDGAAAAAVTAAVAVAAVATDSCGSSISDRRRNGGVVGAN